MDGPAPANPKRAFHRLGDVARMLRVAPSAVRYWQQEFFPHVHPARTRSGQNVYSTRDVAVLARIRMLVHDERLSIKDARERLRAELAANDGEPMMTDTGFQTELDFAPANAPDDAPRDTNATPSIPGTTGTTDGASRALGVPDAGALADLAAERDRLRQELAAQRQALQALQERHETLLDRMADAIRELARSID
jgi:DNA-binding transcriptional MerR regulator